MESSEGKYNIEEFLGKPQDTLYQGGDVNKTITVQDAFKDAKIILFYFSKLVCPPCKEFTPILQELYGEINEASL